MCEGAKDGVQAGCCVVHFIVQDHYNGVHKDCS